MGRTLLLWVIGLIALYLVGMAVMAILPYLIALAFLWWVAHKIHVWLACKDKANSRGQV